MTLDEAIRHAEEVAKENENRASFFWRKKGNPNYENCVECAEEHRQLAEWLKDYKRLLEQQSEIVRCSQCKYAEVADSEDSQDGYTCQFHRGSIWFSGSYCSWAERRQNG